MILFRTEPSPSSLAQRRRQVLLASRRLDPILAPHPANRQPRDARGVALLRPRAQIPSRLLASLCDQLGEHALRISQHRRRGVHALQPTVLEADHLVVLDDGVDAVRDGQDRASGELIGDDVLHHLVRLEVHRRRRLVEAHDFSVPQQGPRQAEHLPLSGAVVLAVLRDGRREPDTVLADGLLELHGLEREPEFLVTVLLKRVEVIADVTREQDGILGYARDPAPEVFQAERARVGAVEPDAPATGLHQSPERDDEGALAAAGATADANLLASFHVKRDPFQHKRKAGSVPHLQSLERYSARGGPARWRLLRSALDDCTRRLLRLKLGILRDSLHAHHVGLELGYDAYEPGEQPGHVDGVAEGQAHQRGVGTTPLPHPEDCHDERDGVPDRFKTNW
mmetsp:Transcript_11183/g.45038  ORF Transcript_11183/g.45038 Transcript_11183/m.45038 type:complete len:396 (+) Transcript_11183:38-1225(+)